MKQKVKRPSLNEAFKRVQRLPKMDRWAGAQGAMHPPVVPPGETKPALTGAKAAPIASADQETGSRFLTE